VLFYIDGTLVATVSSHVPRAAKTIYYVEGICDQGAAAKLVLSTVALQSNL
jgi:hypothetical protein